VPCPPSCCIRICPSETETHGWTAYTGPTALRWPAGAHTVAAVNTTAPNSLHNRTVVLIGGASGIGLRVAYQVVQAGGSVVLGGRTAATLESATKSLGAKASWQVIDTSDQASVDQFFDAVDVVHGLFTTAATYITGSIAELSIEAAATPFTSKFWGQYRVVRAALPKLAADASIVLMSGAASSRPAGNAPAYVAANAAIEGLARGLAVELAPVRVNAISPGTVAGNLWDRRDAAGRDEAFAHFAATSVLGRVVTEDEVASAVIHLLLNTATTGSTLFVDGGYTLR
jgi:NAD(P)-dependent dehydrogenase (short-subunit alcohol dehydrogenase family)